MTDQVSMGAARAIVSTVVMIVSCAACETGDRQSSDTTRAAEVSSDTTAACASDNGGLTLPDGFCATVFADSVGHARHMAVAPNGVVYVNTWSGRYYGNAPPPRGGFLIVLPHTNTDYDAVNCTRVLTCV